MVKKLFALLVFAALLLILNPAVYAQPLQEGRTGPEPEQGKMQEMRKFKAQWEEKLNLSPEQKTKLKAIRSKYADKITDIKLSTQKSRIELAQLLREDNLDRAKIDAKLEENLKNSSMLQKTMLQEFFDAREILTPEQRKIFADQLVRMLTKGK
jgi:periplasmic protein CpxP/Spy